MKGETELGNPNIEIGPLSESKSSVLISTAAKFKQVL